MKEKSKILVYSTLSSSTYGTTARVCGYHNGELNNSDRGIAHGFAWDGREWYFNTKQGFIIIPDYCVPDIVRNQSLSGY